MTTQTASLAARLAPAAAVLSFLLTSPGADAAAPGGFIERADTTVARALLSPSAIQTLLPARGAFTFPAPYATQAVRITNASDCGGSADCVNYVGYGYWRNINNHVGSDTLLMFVGLSQARGGTGPTLFSYHKPSGALTKLGPLFDANSKFASLAGEGFYFSATRPNALYVYDGPRMLRYDVLARTFETVFDVSAQYGADKYLWQMHSSNDDRVHSATLRRDGTWEMLGCIAYREDTRQTFYYPKQGEFDECQVDKSGRYLVIKENVDGAAGEDNRIVDLEGGTERVLLDQAGAGGHSDLGYASMVAADNFASQPNSFKVWDLAAGTLAGSVVHYNRDWNVQAPNHVSFANARNDRPLAQQYSCGSSANRNISPHANEVVCFRLDGSLDVLVVAPVMTDLNASGGGDDYAKLPKGNLDVTGEYFIWTANMGGNRLDAFLVKVPTQLLVAPPVADTTAPAVAISAPLEGAQLSAPLTVTATASDAVGVVGVQFLLDGTNLGAEDLAAPFGIALDPAALLGGNHTLSAVARDAAGNRGLSLPVNVSTLLDLTAPSIAALGSAVGGTSTATVTWTTDELADSLVEYGTTVQYGQASAIDHNLALSHAVNLSGLVAGTTYHYRAISWDGAGNQAISADRSFVTAAAAPPPPPTSGLPLAHWALDEGSGSLAADSSANRNDGSLINAPAWTAGKLGRALAFSGTNDYVQMPSSASLNAYPLSIALWLKTGDTKGLHGIVNKYWPGSKNGYQLSLNNGSLCASFFRNGSNFVWDGGNCTLRTPGFADGQWHHVAVVVDAAGGRLYVDGVRRASRAWTGTPGAPSDGLALSLARYPGTATPFLPGQLDDVRIYGRALAAAEIAALYNGASASNAVVWTAVVNATATGGTLQKTAGCDGCQDAGAVSQQSLSSKGYLEFTVGDAAAVRYVGLSNGNGGTSAAEIDYALRLQNGAVEVREGGVYRADSSAVSGDKLRVALDNGVVSYYRNGALLYRSTVPPTLPLQADAAILSLGGKVDGAELVAQ